MTRAKNKPLYVAHTAYQFEVLGMSLPTPFDARQTESGQSTIEELLLPGMMIKTNYGSGPYIVHEVNRYALSEERSLILSGLVAWSIVCMSPDDVEMNRSVDYLRSTNRLHYLNEYVAVDGRFIQVFPNNDDEILIVDNPDFLRDRKTGQLRLF